MTPSGSPAVPDPAAVNAMFGRIAGRYDLANRLLSGGMDRWWRRQLVRAVQRAQPRHVLDLATGSGDVAFALRRVLPAATTITGLDFCEPMLAEAERKKARAPRFRDVTFRAGNLLQLPIADASVDAVTIAFGLRNAADRARALSEMRRVLRAPHGRLFVLEFSQPRAWFAPFYFGYLRSVALVLATWCTGDRAAYEYLGSSIAQFPGREAIAAEIRAAGFTRVEARPLTLGAVALHLAQV